MFFKPLEIKDQDAPSGKRTVPMLRYFHVFNVEQCDGLELEPIVGVTHDVDPIESADAVLAGYVDGPALGHGGDRACYSRVADHVQMPMLERFESAESYYLTLWHELTHSTGHRSRLRAAGSRRVRAFRRCQLLTRRARSGNGFGDDRGARWRGSTEH